MSYFNKTCHELLDSFWRKITSTNSNISNMSRLLRKISNMELENSPPSNTTKSFELIWTITKPWLFPFPPFDFGGSVTLTFTPPLFCSPSTLPPGNQRESPGCPGHLAENVAHAWVPSKHQRPETGWRRNPTRWALVNHVLNWVTWGPMSNGRRYMEPSKETNKFTPWEKENYRLKSAGLGRDIC